MTRQVGQLEATIHQASDENLHTPRSAFEEEVLGRFGVIPNFFRTAGDAPGLIAELWGFAKSGYLDNPLPSLFKERLFVHLSRFCQVRYCIIRHVGFLVGEGRPAGDAAAQPQTVDQVMDLLRRPGMPTEELLHGCLARLEAYEAPRPIPEPGTEAEADVFTALSMMFLQPRKARRAQKALRNALGSSVVELLTAYLAFIRTAHYWTETHPELGCEADVTELLGRHERLASLLLDEGPATTDQSLEAANSVLARLIEERTYELELSQTQTRVVFDLSPDSLFLVQISDDGEITFGDLNNAAEGVCGCSRERFFGAKPSSIVAAEYAADIERSARACLVTGEMQHYRVTRNYVANRFIIIDTSVALVRRSEGGGGLILFSGRDVTEQCRIEDQLRQSQKMEAVGQLTGGLAHDFNNLLTGVTGNLDLLQTRMRQGRLAEGERYITAAQGAAQRAAALTHRLLAFSRQQTLEPKPTDVNRLVVGLEDLVRRTVGPAIEVETVGAEGLWTTLVDAGQLENALLNLCINARDAMPDGGRITIETTNKWLDDRAAKDRDVPPGQYITLCVSDNGTGMPAEVIARAFDPFFTTKPIGQGTGLGLSMIYGFARQSGGQVRIHSEVGLGTMICLYLPRHLGEADGAGLAAEFIEAPRADVGETVLVIDDEPTVRMLVTEVLEDLGYAAIEAADGPSGLRVLQSSARVDLLVTDVGLPGGMNGRQVADAARVARPDLKVLFITGYAENAVLNHGHLAHGMHVMTKPFAMDALAGRIKDLLTRT